MNLAEAIESCKEGNFVTNEYFSSDQSMHWYRNHLYYEDGAIIEEYWLAVQDFAIKGNWKIKYTKDQISTSKLQELHLKSYISHKINYEDAVVIK